MGFKKTGMLLILTLCTAFAAGCGKDKDNGNAAYGGGAYDPYGNGYAGDTSGRVAHVPTADVCLQNRQVQPHVWNPYQQYGFRNFNYNGFYGAGIQGHGLGHGYGHGGYGQGYGHHAVHGHPAFANGFGGGCPSGYQPVCDPRVGMSCMPVQLLQNNPYQLVWYGWNSGMNNFAVTSGRYLGYNSGQMSQMIGQTCQIGFNSCGYGTCRPVTYGSTIGVCAY